MNTLFVVSRRYDAAFFLLAGLLPIFLWGLTATHVMSALGVYLMMQLLLNLPHNAQTWTLSVLDPEDRAKNGRRYALAFAIILFLAANAAVWSPDRAYLWVRDAAIYWGFFHVARQHFGLFSIYERRLANAGAPSSAREKQLYTWFLDLTCLGPVIARFSDPRAMTVNVAGQVTPVVHVPLPASVGPAIFAACGLAILLMIIAHLVALHRGRPVLVRGLFLLVVSVTTLLACACVENLFIVGVMTTSYHDVQYLALVGFHHRNSVRSADAEKNPALRLLANGRLWLYVVLTLAFGLVVALPKGLWPSVRLAEVPFLTVVCLHYFVDSSIWRLRERPRVVANLQLARVAA